MSTLGYYSGVSQDPTSQWVMADYPCRKCNGNLRGQHIGGRCPQCGTPVGLSFYGELFQYADPAWLATLRSGLLTVLWATIGMIVALLIAAGVMVAMLMADAAAIQGGGNFNTIKDFPPSMMPAFIAIMVIVTVGWLIIAYGTWLFATPDPGGTGEDRYGGLRKFVRVSSFIGLGVGLVYGGMFLAGLDMDGGPLGIGYQILSTAFHVVALVAEGIFLGHLAARVPDPKLSARFKTAGWAMGVAMGVMTLLQLVILALGVDPTAAQRGGMDSGLVVFNCVNSLVGLAMLVFFIIFLVAVGQLAGRLRQARDYSKAVWAQPYGAQAAPGVGPPAGQGQMLPPGGWTR